MAAIDYFVSVPGRGVVSGDTNNAGMNSGTATSATDFIELRMRVQDGSSVATGLTRADVIRALKNFERWIVEGGAVVGTGTNVPFAT